MSPQTVQQLVNIKGTPNGLLIYCNGQADPKALEIDLRTKLGAGKGFFRGAKYSIYGKPPLDPSTLDKLHTICTEHGLTPAEAEITPPQQAVKPRPKVKTSKTTGRRQHSENEQTHLLQRSLRSGTKETYDGNVVILGDVNPGAEIRATGDILVMGALRGVAHAGCNGNINAVIVAYKLHPSQLRIANKIARSPEGLAERPYPELAYATEEDGIIIEKYNPNKRR